MRTFYLFQVVGVVGAQSVHKCKSDVHAGVKGLGRFFITQQGENQCQGKGKGNDDRDDCQVLFPQPKYEEIDRPEKNAMKFRLIRMRLRAGNCLKAVLNSGLLGLPC